MWSPSNRKSFVFSDDYSVGDHIVVT